MTNSEQTSIIIISKLQKGVSQNDIIVAICEQYGMQWDEAEKLIEQIESENQDKINSFSNKNILILTIVLNILGLTFVMVSILSMINGVGYDMNGITIPHPGIIVSLVVGIAMLVGGINGIFSMGR